MAKRHFNRIVLKLSGEALMGENQYGIDPQRLSEYAQEIKKIHALGVEIAIVIGGGNIFRGVAGASKGMDRVQGDYMGMLATVINGMALQGALEGKVKIPTLPEQQAIGTFFQTLDREISQVEDKLASLKELKKTL